MIAQFLGWIRSKFEFVIGKVREFKAGFNAKDVQQEINPIHTRQPLRVDHLDEKFHLPPTSILMQKEVDEFVKAATIGDRKIIEKYIQAHKGDTAAIDQYSSGSSAMLRAAQNGHLDIVTSLLAAGSNVNAGNCVQATPLYTASVNGHEQVVRKLLTVPGIKIDTFTHFGDNPLATSAREGKFRIVKILLEAGAKVVDYAYTRSRLIEKNYFHILRVLEHYYKRQNHSKIKSGQSKPAEQQLKDIEQDAWISAEEMAKSAFGMGKHYRNTIPDGNVTRGWQSEFKYVETKKQAHARKQIPAAETTVSINRHPKQPQSKLNLFTLNAKTASISAKQMAESVFGCKRPESHNDVWHGYIPKYRP